MFLQIYFFFLVHPRHQLQMMAHLYLSLLSQSNFIGTLWLVHLRHHFLRNDCTVSSSATDAAAVWLHGDSTSTHCTASSTRCGCSVPQWYFLATPRLDSLCQHDSHLVIIYRRLAPTVLIISPMTFHPTYTSSQLSQGKKTLYDTGYWKTLSVFRLATMPGSVTLV